jgi:hypothetical protein
MQKNSFIQGAIKFIIKYADSVLKKIGKCRLIFRKF